MARPIKAAAPRQAERGHAPGIIILDGSVDWLTRPDADLLTALRPDPAGPDAPQEGPRQIPPVRTQIGADARCAVVAAASVLAKVERDALMAGLEDPGYDWASNKGYATPSHVAGLERLGACDQHRRSWRLPGLTSFATG